MTLIQWKDEFSVGVASVDHEHQELIALINSLHDVIQDDDGETPGTQAAVVEKLGEIYAQISAHFALEEKVMRDSHYPLLAEHKEDHEILLDELLEIMDCVEDDGSFDELQLGVSLDRWFSEHFRTHDAKLHRHHHH